MFNVKRFLENKCPRKLKVNTLCTSESYLESGGFLLFNCVNVLLMNLFIV